MYIYIYTHRCIYLYVYTLTQPHSQTLSSPYVLPWEEEPQTVSFLWIDTQKLKQMDAIQFGLDATNLTLLSTYNAPVQLKSTGVCDVFCACLPSRTLPVDYVHFFEKRTFWPLQPLHGKRNTVKSRLLFIQTRLSVGLQGYTTLFGASGCNGAWLTGGPEELSLWLCQNNYWTWWFIVDFPINSMVIFHSYVKLPEGIPVIWATQGHKQLPWLGMVEIP